jgi:hypothetical protein
MNQVKISSDKERKRYETIVEIEHLEKSISSIEDSINDIEERYRSKISDIEEEFDYSIIFKVSMVICGILFLFQLTFSSFFFFILVAAGYMAFKKYLDKNVRKDEFLNQMKLETEEKKQLLEKQKLRLSEEKKKL